MLLSIVAPLLAAWALLALLLAVGLFVCLAVPSAKRSLAAYAAREQRSLLALAWLFAATATAGSLYFSEVVGFEPCLLCWYQRTAMYPLVVVLGVAVLHRDAAVWPYALPLAGAGAIISIYHVIIQLRPELDVVTCSLEAPCTLRYVAAFGFVSIPFMAGSGFLGIAAVMLALRDAGRAAGAP